MSVLASSSGESTHDPPDGVLDRGRPAVVMDAFPLHSEPWYLSSPLSSALGLSRHHRRGVLGLSLSRSGTNFFIAVYSVI